MTNQPKWKYVGNIGDESPLEYGGVFVFVDTTGVYSPEMTVYRPDDMEYCRIVMDRMALTTHGLINARQVAERSTLPYPIETYVEWWDKDLQSIADFNGIEMEDLVNSLCSEDPLHRAWGYKLLLDYFGPENMGDSWEKIPNFQAYAKWGRLKVK